MMVEQMLKIPLTEIDNDENFNCRGPILPIDVIDLANDIKEKGLIQPILIAPYSEENQKEKGKKYQLLSGFRRFMAHKVNGATTIQCVVKEKALPEADARIFNLAENIQRKDLNILQEARAIKRLKDLGVGQEEAVRRLGKSRGWIQIRYMLLGLPEELQKEAAAGSFTQTEIRNLNTIFIRNGKEETFEVAKKLIKSKERGEKISIKPKSKNHKHSKKVRDRTEIFTMMNHMREFIGNGLYTRALAWAVGEISEMELYYSIKLYAEEMGKTYSIPN
jgi:ParB family chromosome partitioning protein